MNLNSCTWLEDLLPPHRSISPRSEADFYGASTTVASLLNKSHAPKCNGSWKHGWGGLLPLLYPEQLVFSGHKADLVLVHTLEQQEFLVRHGYRNVHAAGMPFIYSPQIYALMKRRRGSLLVMPPHSSKFISPAFNEKEYVESILTLKSVFDEIVVCVSKECILQGKWYSSFAKAGLPVVVGADVSDGNALARMATIFNSFETVTSPSIGSHFVYAGLCGCKLSLWGKGSFDLERKDLLDEPYYQRFPWLVDFMFSDSALKYKEEVCSRFKCRPDFASTHMQWAGDQAGEHLRLAPSSLAYLFGWTSFEETKDRLIDGLSPWLARFKLAISDPLHYPSKAMELLLRNR